MKRGITGQYLTNAVTGEPFRAFVPFPLPPSPPLDFSRNLRTLFDEAHLALGRLDGAARLLPDLSLFIYMYVRKEAVLSSQIEGTQSTLMDLLKHEVDEAPGVPLDDVRQVSNYVRALDHAMMRLREGFPLSLRLLRECHVLLLAGGRGAHQLPGEFRRSQNWIGGTRPGNAIFVPPPAEPMMECLDRFEKFLHDFPEPTPPLIKAALAHVQFETIHPFLDGNGRIGRMLIVLLLCSENVLKEPIFYPSLYFRQHRRRYYELLQQVREEGDWEQWIEFFAQGVKQTADEAALTIARIDSMVNEHRERIKTLGRRAESILRLHQIMLKHPLIGIMKAAELTRMTPNTIIKGVKKLEEMGLVRETTGKARNRIYVYDPYLKRLTDDV